MFNRKKKVTDVESKYIEVRRMIERLYDTSLPAIISEYDEWKQKNQVSLEEITEMKEIVSNKRTNAGLCSDEIASDREFQIRYILYQLDMVIKMDGNGVDYHQYA